MIVLFAKSTGTLKPKKKKVSFSDIVKLIPDESSIKDLKAKPNDNKDSFTYSASEVLENDTQVSANDNYQKIQEWLIGNQTTPERYAIRPAKGVPETLEYLDDYLAKTKNNEKSVAEKRERVESFFKDMIDKNELCMQFPADEGKITNMILEHFKNGFETKTAHGQDHYLEGRKEVDSLVFGMPSDITKSMLKKNEAYKFEKYGYLGAKSSMKRPPYGEVKFIFKKKSLLNRTTMTVGDSFANRVYGVIASRLTNPKVESIPGVVKGDNALLYAIDEMICKKEIKPNMDPLEVAEKIFSRDLEQCFKYIELQFHDDLRIEDVERCELPTNMSKEIRERIKQAAGVKPKLIKGYWG